MQIDYTKFFRNNYYDHNTLLKTIYELENNFDFLQIRNIGKSILGKTIPIITFGRGQKNVIYIGGHHGMEWITCALLMKYVVNLAHEYKNGTRIFDISTKILFESRKIHIVPMLNPDGIGYAIHGISNDNILMDRLIKMNGDSDFSHWQANARGVDLNHNYNAGFKEYKLIEKNLNIYGGCKTKYSGEYPESEPETRSLCNFVRWEKPSLAVTLHTQGEEIYYTSGEKLCDDSLILAKTISRLTGYKISLPSGSAKYGGFTDWFIEEFNRPSFTLECGLGENPLPFSDLDTIYYRIRKALFTIPVLI